MVPELATLLGSGSKYGGQYKVGMGGVRGGHWNINILWWQPPDDKQFVLVCGNITFVSVCNFLDDFYNPAREDVNAEVVFLNKKEPDLEFDGLLKREKTKVKYFTVRETIFEKFQNISKIFDPLLPCRGQFWAAKTSRGFRRRRRRPCWCWRTSSARSRWRRTSPTSWESSPWRTTASPPGWSSSSCTTPLRSVKRRDKATFKLH